MSVALPVDDLGSHRRQPWVLHVLYVNSLNFCSFSYCKSRGQLEPLHSAELVVTEDINELLIAVPNTEISSESVS
jgi:ASTRA-associated protein 1